MSLIFGMHTLIQYFSRQKSKSTLLSSKSNTCRYTIRLNIQELASTQFPQCKKLPEISYCFIQLEKFINNQQSWIQCECQPSNLKQIQKNINLITLLITVQKRYGKEFWHSKYRVQASICHFFSLLNFFLYNLIPHGIDTIEHAIKQNKLCTTIASLQNLVNKILPFMNTISKFLCQESFSQQKNLAFMFLAQVKQMFQKMPKLNKKKFKWQSQLGKYLYVIIPIELSKIQYRFKAKRKKTSTISYKNQVKYNSQDYISVATRQYETIQFKENELRRNMSLPQLYQILNIKEAVNHTSKENKKIKEKFSIQQIQSEKKLKQQDLLPILFQFSQKVRKYSFQLNKKKITITTYNTRQLGFESHKQRKISQFAKSNQSHSKEKSAGRSSSINKRKQSNYQAQITNRSKKSSIQQFQKNIEHQQHQSPRKIKQKSLEKHIIKKTIQKLNIKEKPLKQSYQDAPSKRVNFYEGKTQRWGAIQQNLQMKILKKKLFNLIKDQQ